MVVGQPFDELLMVQIFFPSPFLAKSDKQPDYCGEILEHKF